MRIQLAHAALACLATTLLAVPAGAAELEVVDDRTAFDPATGELVSRAPLTAAERPLPHAAPARRALAPSDGWVGCSTSDDAYPFDPPSETPGPRVDLLPDGNYPYDATINNPADEIWIPGASGDGVVVLARATGAEIARVAVGDYPIGVVFSLDGSLAFVSSRDLTRIDRIDALTHTLIDSTPTPDDPGNMARNPVSGIIYAVHWFGPDLYELPADGSTVLRAQNLGGSLWQLVVSPDGNTVYVTDRSNDLVRLVDAATFTETGTVMVCDDPWGIDVTADGSKLVVACEDDHVAQVVDTSSLAVTTIALDPDADPRDVDILEADRRAYVVGGATAGGSPVYVIDLATDTLLGSFDVPGSNSNVIAVDPAIPPPRGACCDGAGGCTVEDVGDCTGNYQGDGSDCSGGCGACCAGALICDDTIAAQCSDSFVAGTFCGATPDPCATGACCDSAGGCSVETPGTCVGDYQGDGSRCDTACGACCSTIDCRETLAARCTDTFIAGTFCAASPDPCRSGACCDGAGGCTVEEAATCAGEYQGDLSDCSTGCGSCCYAPDFCMDSIPGQCGGDWKPASFCAATPNPCSAGACCDGAGGCSITSETDCMGEFQGDGSDCTTACGACCDGAGGCTDSLQSQCTGTFIAAGFCAATPDPCAAGACCDGLGGCAVALAADCTGTYQGDGAVCGAGCGACCDALGGCADSLASLCMDTFVAASFCAATPDPCAGCVTGDLQSVGNSLRSVRSGPTRLDMTYHWLEPGDGASEYHVNYVPTKQDIPSANRTPGPALDACTIEAPADQCTEPSGVQRADPDGAAYYQSLSACGSGGASEGPL